MAANDSLRLTYPRGGERKLGDLRPDQAAQPETHLHRLWRYLSCPTGGIGPGASVRQAEPALCGDGGGLALPGPPAHLRGADAQGESATPLAQAIQLPDEIQGTQLGFNFR